MSNGRFSMLVIDTEEMTVTGTNDVEALGEQFKDDRYIILMPQHGVFFNGDRTEQKVEELQPFDLDEDEGCAECGAEHSDDCTCEDALRETPED